MGRLCDAARSAHPNNIDIFAAIGLGGVAALYGAIAALAAAGRRDLEVASG